jgi:FdhD protein
VADSRLQVPVRRVEGGSPLDDTDWVAAEEPLEIRVRMPGSPPAGEPLVITMRTPGHDEDLSCGFLFTEGLIAGHADVAGVSSAEPGAGEGNVVTIELHSDASERLATLRRNFYTSSSCGICGKTSLEALRARARLEVRGEDLRMNPAALAGLPQALARRQPTFASTGGLHAAALFGADGEILNVREDVGRHNAVDKLIGAALRAGRLPFWNLGILVSGRASFEIVEKARMAGCPLVVAVGAPSSLAIDAAWESGITLVGFLRDGRFNVYTIPARVGTGA